LLTLGGRADAHGLNAGYRVLSGNRVQVESWFETDEPASGARVQVLHGDEKPLVEGRLDARGIWVFRFPSAERLRVVVRDGAGHKAQVVIEKSELAASVARGTTGQVIACLTGLASPLAPPPLLMILEEAPSASSPERADSAPPLVDRSRASLWREVLTGVAFLLSLAAFVLSIRNGRALRELQKGRI
jgi:hypothetical protein